MQKPFGWVSWLHPTINALAHMLWKWLSSQEDNKRQAAFPTGLLSEVSRTEENNAFHTYRCTFIQNSGLPVVLLRTPVSLSASVRVCVL